MNELPHYTEMKDWNELSARQQKSAQDDYEKSKPYLERILALKAEMDQLKQDMREDGVWDLFCPTFDVERELNDIGFHDTWLPSALDC